MQAADRCQERFGQRLLLAGRHVARGELICELDSTTIKRRLELATIELQRTEALLSSARYTVEAAELAVGETGAVLNEEREGLNNSITIAEKELDLARQLLDESVKRNDRNDEQSAAQASVQKAELKLTQAHARLADFEKLVVPKRLDARRAVVAGAKKEVQAAEQVKAAADSAAARLRQQLKNCRIVAPMAGRLLYVRPPGTTEEGMYVVLDKGIVVRERQPLFRIVPDPPPPVDNARGPG